MTKYVILKQLRLTIPDIYIVSVNFIFYPLYCLFKPEIQSFCTENLTVSLSTLCASVVGSRLLS